MALKDLIERGFGIDRDFNCAEKILYGANEVYRLGLDKKSLKMAAGFGGGMAVGSVCGALTGSIMVLGNLFVRDRAHESTRIKDLVKEMLASYEKEMGCINCEPLKAKYRTEKEKCNYVILKAAEALDAIVRREREK